MVDVDFCSAAAGCSPFRWFLGRADARAAAAVLTRCRGAVVSWMSRPLIVLATYADQLRGQAGAPTWTTPEVSAMRSRRLLCARHHGGEFPGIVPALIYRQVLRWWRPRLFRACCATVRSCRWTRQICRPPRWPMD